MAYSFSSDNKLVSVKTERFNPEQQPLTNLMHNKRVFRGHIHNVHNIRHQLSPLEQEHQHMQTEKENRQIEMLKSQIESFKNSKIKMTPYDIRPAPAARIPIDLQYFLTEHQCFRQEESDTFTQTEPFLKSKLRAFVPKKTGIDMSTQVWDGDLFNFNLEVAPIVQVLAFKTIEDAWQEAEEEAELKEFTVCSERVEKGKMIAFEEESELLETENRLIYGYKSLLQRKRDSFVKKENFVNKVENINVAKKYLENIFGNTVNRLYEENVFPDYRAQSVDLKCCLLYTSPSPRDS